MEMAAAAAVVGAVVVMDPVPRQDKAKVKKRREEREDKACRAE